VSDEKTEKPTGKRISDAFDKGQFARTPEIQTVFVLSTGFLALSLLSPVILKVLTGSMYQIWGHLTRATITIETVQGMLGTFLKWLGICTLPIMGVAVVAGVLGSGLQSRFHLTTQALQIKWERLNPISNAQQFFQVSSTLARLSVSFLKFMVVFGFTYSVVRNLMTHPVFYAATSFTEVMLFMAKSAESIGFRVVGGLVLIAAGDYAFQMWKNHKGLMMSKEEVKEETKSSEGSPLVKGELRKRRMALLRQNWLAEIPKADVVVTNPTHLSIVLRYDRKTMKAPKIVAKGARLNALRIREIAAQFQIPIVENKPAAQLMFKYAKVGQEIPPQVYTAVAEILAYVYRVNRYKYYSQGQQIPV
jgi:flagellar biosynthetic protein FlhB